ncbi:NADH:flavin oxidoreductase/NADH oxidase [Enterovirga rhinocerotis]|uniref:2,4-dienoyl-CoA reductase-like NADH-dependent reductase (Old Yellow Enzyme family) n=1 Tax=Enterovirga rhinocerotis TaxID=1339210 RepID=A0A4R7C3D0_9HYPH|nr:NADH:flavin oxidoreductase/NADH oxidase [Enterovirga rhinocerotis]TDR92934.1 2,4-dienoyl-CoA reductase-like NADH-dependent reductase (Old Yellow Enzyme family) [Enterovirga rhinocerotis]
MTAPAPSARQGAAEGPLLFSPLALRGLTIRNRVMVSPMCQYRSVEGGPTDWHIVHLGQFAIGGAGIVFGDETAVEERGRKTHDCAGLYTDRHVAQYLRITTFLKSLGAAPAIQLGHAGRKASCHGAMRNWAPLRDEDAADGRAPWTGTAPSAIPAGPGAHLPRAMSIDDIRTQREIWRVAALRAVDAGFDICEIHAAHGYLLHQFLSPISNRRTDSYGGDRDGRMRFLFEITETVRAAWPADRPLFVRLSCVDGRGGLWDMDDTLALAAGLKERGVDVIDCSSGGIQGDSPFPLIPRVPGYHVGYASRIRSAIGIPTVAVGLITDPHHAEAILREEHADIAALARGLMEDPAWAAKAARILGTAPRYGQSPPDYAYRFNGRDRSTSGYPADCAATVPHAIGDDRPYRWPRPSPPETA